jgi:hypothetical protein
VIALDSHVHFHDCFDEEALLDAAVSNVRGASTGRPLPQLLVLLLAESAGANWFEHLWMNGLGENRWQVSRGTDQLSLRLSAPDQIPVLLVAGRQIECRERIEVLALGARDAIEDGQPVVDVLKQVESLGALPVLPWGFGKWLGRRGSIIGDLITDPPVERLWLGDNAGRLRGAPAPKLFADAQRRGIHVLPGSDALPFRNEVGKAGRVGCFLSVDGAMGLWGLDVLNAIRDADHQPATFGRQEAPWRFARNQVGMQARKFA